MSRFRSLAIAKVEPETRDAVAITFALPDDLREQFRFVQGQHLTLRAVVGGQELRRSYSIVGAAGDPELRIAIKRNPGGVFSNYANEHLHPGDALDVLPPAGHFHVAIDRSARERYVGFAAGSGITPILSIVRTTLAQAPASEFTLFYGNRTTDSVMFKEELAGLKDLHLGRFNLIHVLSREDQDVELLSGRIDEKRAARLLSSLAPDPASIAAVFVCGPDGMMRGVAAALAASGIPAAKIRIERFATSVPRPDALAGTPVDDRAASYTVTAIVDGVTRTFALDRARETILEAGLRHGLDLPYSCRGGVCATCRARVVDGEVEMDVNYALEQEEVERGFVLTCQSRPTSDKVTVDYDPT